MSSRPRTSGLSTSTCRSNRPGPEQRGVEHLGPVGGAHDDDALARIEAVHLGEQLVERLLALLVAAHRALDAHLAERVQLVDEDDARRLGFGLREQIAHARRADADEHLDELRSAQAEERHVRLAGDGARQQRLARFPAGRPAARPSGCGRRGSCTSSGVLRNSTISFSSSSASSTPATSAKLHLDVVVGVDLRVAARERHDAALGAAHAPEEEAPDGDEEEQRA